MGTAPRPLPAPLARLGARHPLAIAAVIVTVAVTVVATITTLAGFLADRWWVFDIVTSYRPQEGIALTVAVVMAIALRCWKILPVAVLALALNVWQVRAGLPGAPAHGSRRVAHPLHRPPQPAEQQGRHPGHDHMAGRAPGRHRGGARHADATWPRPSTRAWPATR